MKRNLLLLLLIVLFGLPALYAQNLSGLQLETKQRKHGTYLELGGWGMFYSLNYEYRHYLDPMQRFTLGTGFTLFKEPDDDDPGLFFERALILKVGYLYGKTHHFEVEPGAYFYRRFEYESSVLPHLWLGYRYESPKGFLVRTGASMHFIGLLGGFIAFPWPGISVGKAF